MAKESLLKNQSIDDLRFFDEADRLYRVQNFTGQTIANLLVLGFAGIRHESPIRSMWHCLCACGMPTTCNSRYFTRRPHIPKSCGCVSRRNSGAFKLNFRERDPLWRSTYLTWAAMRQRCGNPKSDSYRYYGGRGISICQRWLDSFENFVADMGIKPSRELSIDRIDVNGNYEPSNCRWATAKQQLENRRVPQIVEMIEFEGECLSKSQWAAKIGMSLKALSYRLNAGWTLRAALTTPYIKNKKARSPKRSRESVRVSTGVQLSKIVGSDAAACG